MNAPAPATDFALSPLHAAVQRVRRCFDAAVLNEIVNHPAVLPHVGGTGQELDLGPVVQDITNIALYDDGIAGIFNCLAPGIYELHSMAVPERRGKPVMSVAAACFHIMFTRSPAIEIITRVPHGNLRALVAAKAAGFRLEFETAGGWITPEGPKPVAWYRLSLQDWASRAPGLIERGRWFHAAVDAACERAGIERDHHPDDDTHNRYAGMACEMILGGMLPKGIHFLNRYNAITRARPVQVLSHNPLVIHIGDVAIGIDLETETIEIVKAQ